MLVKKALYHCEGSWKPLTLHLPSLDREKQIHMKNVIFLFEGQARNWSNKVRKIVISLNPWGVGDQFSKLELLTRRKPIERKHLGLNYISS